jgi:predicted nuclease with RNAse H fold
MKVLGIDLAAQAGNTGAVMLDIRAGDRPQVMQIRERLNDDVLVRLAGKADLVGIDAPLGWPVSFVAAVSAHERREPWLGEVDRTELCFRRTDHAVRDRTGSWPLSVSADKLGIVAMRCALLQERFAREVWAGERQPRHGSGRLVETYPAATLQVLGLPFRSYKGDGEGRAELRRKIVEGLAPLVDIDDVRAACLADDNVLDAVVAAYVTWLDHERLTVCPSGEDHRFALVEGWIHLPCNGH